MSTQQSTPAAVQPHEWLYAVFPPLFWAGNFFLARLFRDEIPPFQMSFWRWLLALLILLPFAWRGLRNQGAVFRREMFFLAMLGLTGVTAFNCFVYVALRHTTVLNAALINSFMPVMTFVFAYFLLGQKLRPVQLLGVALSIVGAGVVILRGDLLGIANLALNAGDLLVVCGLSSWALYTVLIRWRPSALPLLPFLLAITAFGTLFHLPLVAYEWVEVGGFAPDAARLAAIVYLAIFPSLLAYIFWGRAVKRLGPGKTAMFMHLLPVFSAFLAIMFLGEQAHLYHAAGLFLIIAGITLVTQPPRRIGTD